MSCFIRRVLSNLSDSLFKKLSAYLFFFLHLLSSYLPDSNVNHVESRPYLLKELRGHMTSLTLALWMSQRQMFSCVICIVHSPQISKFGVGIRYTLNRSGKKQKVKTSQVKARFYIGENKIEIKSLVLMIQKSKTNFWL